MFENEKIRVARCFSLIFYFSHHKIPTDINVEKLRKILVGEFVWQ